MPSAVNILCEVCSKEIHVGDQFCGGCGRVVTDQDRALLQTRLEAGDYAAYDRGKKVREAAKWVGVLAILFAVSGALMFVMQKIEADKALVNLARFEPTDQLEPIDGKTYTAGELRALVEREPYQVLIVNLILAVLMTVLWLWARRAPLPAIACALALFVVVHVGSALVDPASIPKGIIIKVVAIVVLVKGFKAALQARALMRRPAA